MVLGETLLIQLSSSEGLIRESGVGILLFSEQMLMNSNYVGWIKTAGLYLRRIYLEGTFYLMAI